MYYVYYVYYVYRYPIPVYEKSDYRYLYSIYRSTAVQVDSLFLRRSGASGRSADQNIDQQPAARGGFGRSSALGLAAARARVSPVSGFREDADGDMVALARETFMHGAA